MTIPTLALAVPEWHQRANCAGTDPDEWYPDKGGRSDLAKSICQRCPVKTDCLRDALDRNEQHGIWGGLSEIERRELKRGPRGASVTPIRKYNRRGPGDHHDTIVAMLSGDKPATWAEIGAAIGYSGSAAKAYWKRQRQAAEQAAVAA